MKYSILKNHIAIQGWMVEDMHLRCNKLIIFAIIWGFTGNQKSTNLLDKWTINYRYIEAWTGLSENMTDIILIELEQAGYIEIDDCAVRVTPDYQI